MKCSSVSQEGARIEDMTDYFYGNDEAFKSGLEATLRSVYSQLFDEMGAGAFDADKSDLVHWFHVADKTSELVGQRQASTFQMLAALAGHGELPTARGTSAKKSTAAGDGGPAKKAPAKKAMPTKNTPPPPPTDGGGGGVRVKSGQDVGLTVRIEVNLPPDGDAATYDAIFASIRKHLMP